MEAKSVLRRSLLGKKPSHCSKVDSGLFRQEIQDSDFLELAVKRLDISLLGTSSGPSRFLAHTG